MPFVVCYVLHCPSTYKRNVASVLFEIVLNIGIEVKVLVCS